MFSMPGKQAVTLTPRAVSQIARLMARDKAAGLRLGIKKGGWMRWSSRMAPGC
jgi:iron-sulfur cluster assembly protein